MIFSMHLSAMAFRQRRGAALLLVAALSHAFVAGFSQTRSRIPRSATSTAETVTWKRMMYDMKRMKKASVINFLQGFMMFCHLVLPIFFEIKVWKYGELSLEALSFFNWASLLLLCFAGPPDLSVEEQQLLNSTFALWSSFWGKGDFQPAIQWRFKTSRIVRWHLDTAWSRGFAMFHLSKCLAMHVILRKVGSFWWGIMMNHANL